MINTIEKPMEEIKEFEVAHTEKGILITNLNTEIKAAPDYNWVAVYGWGGVVTQALKNEAINECF